MEPAWYLDAWDAAGGRAFASFRAPLPGSDSADFDPRQLCGDAAFLVRPPSFEIERIVNPTVGLAAGRSGLFLQRLAIREGGDEIAFASAEDVAEFVRRAFSASDGDQEGGTSIGGGGEPPAPQPSEEQREIERLAVDLQNYCARFTTSTYVTGMSTTEPSNIVTLAGKTYVPSDLVIVGALETAHVLLYRVPPATETGRWAPWRWAAGGLADVIDAIGAASAVLSDPLEARSRWILQSWVDARDDGDRAVLTKDLGSIDRAGLIPLIVTLLRGYSRDWGVLEAAGIRMRYWDQWNQIETRRDRDPWGATKFLNDRFESLRAWPSVADATRTASAPASMQALLGAYVGAPGQFAKAPAAVHGQVLFAAAYLAARPGISTTLAEAGDAAEAWLDRSMPRRVFDRQLEQVIAQAAMLQRQQAVGMTERTL